MYIIKTIYNIIGIIQILIIVAEPKDISAEYQIFQSFVTSQRIIKFYPSTFARGYLLFDIYNIHLPISSYMLNYCQGLWATLYHPK